MNRARWDFPYAPLSASLPDDDGAAIDVVVATRVAVSARALRRALSSVTAEAAVSIVMNAAPLHWARVRAQARARRADLGAALRSAGVPVRYVASARTASMALPPPLALDRIPRRTIAWRARPPRAVPDVSQAPGSWFLREEGGGVAVDRQLCGTGAGTKLAVIDDDVADADLLDLDELVSVGAERAHAASAHAASMIGWAVSARRRDGTRFDGVAPEAAVRLYAIPKPDADVVSLAVAVARAALDGADVIVCATYVDGSTSPMLDDAFEVATRLGRGGLGAVVVMPTGREASSAPGCVHSSLSLSLGAPASDPRVACVAPGGREGGWFLWRGRDGRARPFANRGPAVRWLAPGDDIAYPFSARDRPFHAESSGAAAIAAGVVLLVLANNAMLRLGDLHAIVARTLDAPDRDASSHARSLADPADVRPHGADRDGHDAKHGYGRMHATRACLAARDPVAMQLVAMGDDGAAAAWVRSSAPWTPELGGWAVCALLGDAALEHAARALLRHARLLSAAPDRAGHRPAGSLARQVALVLRSFEAGAEPSVAREIARWAAAARDASNPAAAAAFEQCLVDRLRGLWIRPEEMAPVTDPAPTALAFHA